MKQLEDIYKKVGIKSLDNRQFTDSESTKFLTLIKALENSPLSKEQNEIVKELKKIVQNTKEEAQNSDKSTHSMSTDFEFIEKSLQAGFANQNIDLKPVLEDCMGQMELLEELVRMFKQNVWEFIGNAKINVQ